MTRFCRNCRLDFDDVNRDACPTCGTQLVVKNKSLFEGRYRVNRMLDMTSLSQVYLASDEEMENRPVAIKLIFKYDGTGDEDGKLTHREQQIASRVTHPNLVTTHDVGTTIAGEHYLVMEYVRGHTLAEVLRTEKRLDFTRTARIMLQVCDALKAMHAAGFVHKDLKPDNIILVDNGQQGKDFVKILDFGISQPLSPKDRHGSGDLQIMGTPAYMSPEQTSDRFVGIASDIYSAGAMMYEMLLGEPPFNWTEGPMVNAHRKYTPESLKLQGLADLPVAMDDLVLQMLSKDVAMRPENFEEVMAQIEQVLNPWRRPGKSTGLTGKFHVGTTVRLRKPVRFQTHPEDIKKIINTFPRKTGEKTAVWSVSGRQGVGKSFFMNNLADAVRQTFHMDTYTFSFLGGDYPIEVLRILVDGLLKERELESVDLRSGLLSILKQTCIIHPEDLVQRIISLLLEPEKLLALKHLQANILENYIFATVYDLLDAYSRLTPVFLCFDDCHLYGEMFNRFIMFLQSKAVQSYLALAIVTIQNTPDNQINDEKKLSERIVAGMHHLMLRPLSETRMQTMLKEAFPLPLDPYLAQEIITRAEGYPGQAMEYCRYINSLQGFTDDNEKIGLANEDILKSVPPTLEEMYKKRLAILKDSTISGAGAMEVLKRIALAGPWVTKTVLSGILEVEGRLDLKAGINAFLKQLIRQDFLVSMRAEAHEKLQLSHPLLALVLKNNTLETPNPEMMMAIAYVLETTFQDRLPDYYETLAVLYEKAGYTTKAIQFHVLLARQSYTRLNFYNAVRHFRTARLLMQQKNMENTPKWRLVCRELGRVLKDMGNYKEALDAYGLTASPEQVKKATPNELKELMEITEVLLELREDKHVSIMLKSMIAQCDKTHAPLMSASCHLMQSRIHIWHGKPDKADRELETAQELLQGRKLTPVHWQLALRRIELDVWKNRFDKALNTIKKLMHGLDNSGYYAMQIEVLFFMGVAYIEKGNLDLAEDAFARGYRMSVKYEFKKGMSRHVLNLANVHLFKGNFERAEKEAKEAMKINKEEIGDPLIETSANLTLSYMCICQQKGDAEKYIQRAMQTSHEHKYLNGMGEATLNLAILRAFQGKWEESEAALQKAEEILRKTTTNGTKKLGNPEIDCLKGGILLHKGRTEDAISMFSQAFEGFLTLGRTMEAGRVRKTMDKLDKGVGNLTLL